MRPRFSRYLTGPFNLFVDPYGVWGMPALQHLTAARPAEKDNEMLFKAVDLGRGQFTDLFIGSSRVDLGLDPDSPALQGGRAYNLGLVGGALRPTLQYLRHALYLEPSIKRGVLGVVFGPLHG